MLKKIIIILLTLNTTAMAMPKCDHQERFLDGVQRGRLLKESDHAGIVLLLDIPWSEIDIKKVQIFRRKRKCEGGECKTRFRKFANLRYTGIANGNRKHFRDSRPLSTLEGERITVRVIDEETKTRTCYKLRSVDAERND